MTRVLFAALLALAISGCAAEPRGVDLGDLRIFVPRVSARPCAVNLAITEGYFSGKRFASFLESAVVPRDKAFQHASDMVTARGWTVHSMSRETGTITASPTEKTRETAVLTVQVRENGSGSRTEASFHVTGDGYAGHDFVQTELCYVLEAATSPGGIGNM